MASLGPRLVIAGTHSGVGKTTIATGLMAALRQRGLQVGAAKIGPDFIDPGYHALATGRSARNLDAWMCGMDAMAPLAGRAGQGSDVLVIEGVMGLFDGAADGSPSSTAEVAIALKAPVVLVIDAASASTSVAATIHGFSTFDPRLTLAGVILNRVGSDSHEAMLRAAIAPLDIPVLGALHRDPGFGWRDRHLGLIPVIEHEAEVAASLDLLATRIDHSCDLQAIIRLARNSLEILTAEPLLPEFVAEAKIAVAAGPAFSFAYRDNLESLSAAGADLFEFDPCVDERLPEGCTGLVAGGGFPEVYAEALSSNLPLLADIRNQVDRGMAVWAECGGLVWLSASLDGKELAGVIDAKAVMTQWLTLGYRSGETRVDTPLGPSGTSLRGHEFHYSTIEPEGSALALSGRHGTFEAGFGSKRVLASYLHVHLGSRPDLAESFIRACADEASPAVV